MHKNYEIIRTSIYSAIKTYEKDIDQSKIFLLYKAK